MMIAVFDRAENTVGKGENAGNRENAGYQHFLLFLQCFPKSSSLRSLKIRIVWLTLSQTSPGFYVFAVQAF